MATPEFLVGGGGIEGAECISEEAKIQKIVKNCWFWQFFPLLTGGKWSSRASIWGKMPPCPPWCRHWQWLKLWQIHEGHSSLSDGQISRPIVVRGNQTFAVTYYRSTKKITPITPSYEIPGRRRSHGRGALPYRYQLPVIRSPVFMPILNPMTPLS